VERAPQVQARMRAAIAGSDAVGAVPMRASCGVLGRLAGPGRLPRRGRGAVGAGRGQPRRAGWRRVAGPPRRAAAPTLPARRGW